MEALAPELLNMIFTSACTDGGLTGCSLSSVSKHIRATSRAARFNTISLSGSPLQLTQFLSCFLAERSVAAIRTPAVRHLNLVAMKHKTAPSRERTPDEVQRELRRIEEEAAKYVEDVSALFSLVARDLETLCLVHSRVWRRLVELSDIRCSAGDFPMLRELTLAGPDPFVSTGTALFPVYPRLERLHLEFVTHFSRQISFTPWFSRAPGITHLCLSEINRATPAMEDLVGDPPRLKNLRHLLLRPRGSPVGARLCGNAFRQHDNMLDALDLFCETAAIRAEVVPNSQQHQEWVGRAKREWLERLEGGPGCWVMSETPAPGGAVQVSESRARKEWRDRVRMAAEAGFTLARD